jgi:hypothetical protein
LLALTDVSTDATDLEGFAFCNGDAFVFVSTSAGNQLIVFKDIKNNIGVAPEIVDTTNILIDSSNKTSMQFMMDANGYCYFTYGGGASATETVIRKAHYDSSTTALVTGEDITCDTSLITNSSAFAVLKNGEIIIVDAGENYIRLAADGTLLNSYKAILQPGMNYLKHFSISGDDILYICYYSNPRLCTALPIFV